MTSEEAYVQGLRVGLLRLQLDDLLSNSTLTARGKERWQRALAAELDTAWDSLRGAAAATIREVDVEEAARAELERRYLDGRPVLFPGVARGWATLVRQTADLAEFDESLPTRVGRRTRKRGGGSAEAPSFEERVDARADELADEARVAAFLGMGERDKALEIGERRLRSSGIPRQNPLVR